MSDHKTLAENCANLCFAGLALAAGSATMSAFIVPIAVLGGYLLDIRGQCDKRMAQKSVDAALKALKDSSDLTQTDLNAALAWLKSRKQDLRLNPAKLAAAAQTGDLPQALFDQFVDDSLAQDGAARRVVMLALTAAYNTCRGHESFHTVFTQEVLIGLAKGHGVVIKKLDRIESKIDALSLSQSEREALMVKVAEAERDLGTTRSLILGFLESILTRDVQPDQIATELFRLAGSWHSAGQRIDALSRSQNLTPELNRLREQAKAVYDAEDAERTLQFMTQIELAEEKALNALLDHERDLADEIARRKEGLIASKTAKRDLYAALSNVEETVKLTVEIVQLGLVNGQSMFEPLMKDFLKWYERGRVLGFAFDANVAVHLAQTNVANANGAEQRADAHNNLGLSLFEIGIREIGQEKLLASVLAYNSALEECVQNSMHLEWAATQNNLGNTFLALGNRLDGPESLQMMYSALEHYGYALQKRTLTDTPSEWATTQNNIGVVFLSCSGRVIADLAKTFLEFSCSHFREALKVLRREFDPLDWAGIQLNLGAALTKLSRLSDDNNAIDIINEAENSHNQALLEISREAASLDWAKIQYSLCKLEIARFDRNGDEKHLVVAKSYLMHAREIFDEADATIQTVVVDRTLVEIDQRSGL